MCVGFWWLLGEPGRGGWEMEGSGAEAGDLLAGAAISLGAG